VPPNEKIVDLIDSAGNLQKVPESRVKDAIRAGARHVTGAERADALGQKAKAAQASTPLERSKAVGEAIGRGVVPFYDTIAQDLGQDSEAALARREALGTAGDVIEIGSLLATTLASGGTNILGKAARLTPTGAITRVGHRAGQRVGKRFGSKTAQLLAEGAVDGSIYNVARTVGEASLQNKELAAEDVAGSLAFGGLTGVLGGGVAAGFSAAAKKVLPRVTLVGKQADEVSDLFATNLAQADDVARQVGVATATPKVIGGPTQKLGAAARKLDEVGIPAGQSIGGPSITSSKRLTKLDANIAVLQDKINKTPALAKRSYGKLLKELEAAEEAAFKARQADRSVTGRLEELRGPVPHGDLTGLADDIRVGRAADEFTGAPASTGSGASAQLRRADTQASRTSPRLQKAQPSVTTPIALGGNSQSGQLLDDALRIDPKKIETLTATRKALQEILGGEISASGVTKALSDVGMDTAKAKNIMRKYGEYIQAAKGASQTGGAASLKHAGFDAITEQIEETVTRALAKNRGSGVAEAFRGNTSKLATMVGAAEAAGVTDVVPLPREAEALIAFMAFNKIATKGAAKRSGLLSGLAGAAVGRGSQAAVGKVARAHGAGVVAEQATRGIVSRAGYKAGRKAADAIQGDLTMLVGRSQTAQGRIGRALGKVARGGGRHSPTLIRTHDVLKGFLEPGEAMPKGEPAQFKTLQEKMAAIVNDPQVILGLVEGATSGLDQIAPETANLARTQLLKTMGFLWQRMPKNSGAMQHLFGDDYQADPREVAKWMRYARAAFDPASIYEDLAALRLTPEQAETAQELHPGHQQEFMEGLMANYESIKRNASVELKVQIGVLLGQPTHASLLQFNQYQATFDQLNEEQVQAAQAAAPDNSGKGTQSAPSAAQKLEARP